MSDTPLDARDELPHAQGSARRLLERTVALLDARGLHRGEVRPRDSFALRNEQDRAQVRALADEYRALSAADQASHPALLNGLGKLLVGAGDFGAAQAAFQAVANQVPSPAARAEALYNAYRAALEQGRWGDALLALRLVVELAPDRLAPFPTSRYDLRRVLGAGGFGTAFLCHDRNFDTEVVIKSLHADDLERSVADVFREARLLLQLSHPAIIRVLDCNFADPATQARPYLVMEFFDGVGLDRFVADRGRLREDELLAVAVPLAEGMKAAHGKNILHRDLKPANVLIRRAGDRLDVRIIDFGLAVRRGPEASYGERSLIGDSIAGTLQYAPPEQMGQAPGVPVGPYSDVYAFGKTCCFALFETTEPRRRQWQTLRPGLADLLEGCIEAGLAERLPDFDAVLQRLHAPAPPAAPALRADSEALSRLARDQEEQERAARHRREQEERDRREQEEARRRRERAEEEWHRDQARRREESGVTPTHERFLALLRSAAGHRNIFVGPDIADTVLYRTVIDLDVPADEYVFAVYFAKGTSGGEGVAIGLRGLYLHGDNFDGQQKTRHVPYDQLAETAVEFRTKDKKLKVQIGRGEVEVPDDGTQRELVRVVRGLAALPRGWHPEMPPEEAARRHERDDLVRQVEPIRAEIKRLSDRRIQAPIGWGSGLLLLVACLGFLACGGSAFLAAFPLWADWLSIGVRAALLCVGLIGLGAFLARSQKRQAALDETVNADLMAQIRASEAKIEPQMVRLGEIDSKPWHPYLTRLEADRRYHPRPAPPYAESDAEKTGGPLLALAMVAGAILLCPGWFYGEGQRGVIGWREGNRLWDESPADAAVQYKKVFGSETAAASLGADERAQAMERILKGSFPTPDADRAAEYLAWVPEKLHADALRGLFKAGWPPDTTRAVLTGWVARFSTGKGKREFTTRALEAALANNQSQLAKQFLAAAILNWQTRKMDSEAEAAAGVLVQRVIQDELRRRQSDPETVALIMQYGKWLPKAGRDALLEELGLLILSTQGAAKAREYMVTAGSLIEKYTPAGEELRGLSPGKK